MSLPGSTGQSSIHGRCLLDRQSKSDVSDFDHLIGAEVGQARLPVKPGDDSTFKINRKKHVLQRGETMSVSQARAAFRKLHDTGCFVIPNPWDVGTARFLRHCGFKALATTSSGAAFSMGLPDTDWAVTLDMALAHIRTTVEATELPVNADFESGYAHEPEAVAENVGRCGATGVAGLSIEDAPGDKAKPLYDLDTAVARTRAARRAIDQSCADVMLVGRAECFLVGRPDLDETIARLGAYASAGADCLYAPGIRTAE